MRKVGLKLEFMKHFKTWINIKRTLKQCYKKWLNIVYKIRKNQNVNKKTLKTLTSALAMKPKWLIMMNEGH